MTIDEALGIVKQTELCWIVFSAETGNVLSVDGVLSDETMANKFEHLGNLSGFGQPVMTRRFKSSSVTREILEKHQTEAEQRKIRVHVLTEWSMATTEQLARILEHGQYDAPMQRDFDSKIIVDNLWELHRDELTPVLRERLEKLLTSDVLCFAAQTKLCIYLTALNGDEQKLKAIWIGAEPGRNCWDDAVALMDALAYVRTTDQEIIGDMLKIFDTDFPFGGKLSTMIALGKIGPAAGSRVADKIRSTVYDSHPALVAVRDRVLERLESEEGEWLVCGDCCYGQVRNQTGFGAKPCPKCLGIGWRSINE